jgi:hypothetical protein
LPWAGREARPAEWWRYRHPIGFSAEDRDALTTDVEADRYVSATTRLGDWGSLRRRDYDEPPGTSSNAGSATLARPARDGVSAGQRARGEHVYALGSGGWGRRAASGPQAA